MKNRVILKKRSDGLINLNLDLKKTSKTNDKQNSDLEKVCRLFGISYLLNELEMDMLKEHIKKIEKEKSKGKCINHGKK